MTAFDPADYADLDPDPYELLMLEEALAETDAEEAAGDYGDDSDPGDGGDPEDGAGASWADQFADAGAALDARNASEAQRVAADIADQLERRPSPESKIARGLQRIGDGTYLPDPYFRGDPAARDPSGRYAASCEGVVDDLGACASRFHQAGCPAAIASAAAAGSFEEAEQWVATLQGSPSAIDVAAAQQQMGLANADHGEPHDPLGLGDWSETFGDSAPLPYAELRDRLTHEMGLSDPPPPRQPAGPQIDVSGWRAALGI